MKRFLSLILCLTMVLTMIPAQALASETEKAQYAVTWEYNPEQVKVEGAETAVEGEDYSVTLTALHSCYRMDVSIYVSGVQYDSYICKTPTKVVTVPATSVTGDIRIAVSTEIKHTEAQKTEEFPGTCMEPSRTDYVTYCSVCQERLRVSSGEGTYAPHEAGTEAGRIEPTCAEEGSIGYYCKYGCGTLMVTEVLPVVEHTPGEPKLDDEWYHTYCTVCETWLSAEYALTQQEAAEKMLKMVNDLRAEHGLQPLQLTQEANDLANLRAVELVSVYSHDSVGGYNDGYDENIAKGQTSVEELYWDWYNSPVHLANMLGEHYEEFGFGLLPGTSGTGLYAVQLFGFHTDLDKDHKCDRGCEGLVGEHTDYNQDHKCDYNGCTEVLSDHSDAEGDRDHACDICQEIVSECYGGKANCCWQAECEECGQPYGETDKTNHWEDTFLQYDTGDGYHQLERTCCYEPAGKEQHSYDGDRCSCGKVKPAGFGYVGTLYWELTGSGKMTIMGEGPIEDGSSWADKKDTVTELIIGNGITAIGKDAFADFKKLVTLTFPGNAAVDSGAFSSCTALKTIVVTANAPMAEYDNNTCKNLPWFQNGTGEIAVTLESGLTAVPAYTFCGASKVTSVTLPQGIVSIGAYAFSSSGLKNISIPESVTTIGAYALSELKNCTILELPDSVTDLGENALSGSGFQAVKLPANLTAISKGLLAECAELNTVAIPTAVTAIGEKAFSGCKALWGIQIPASVTEIAASAFQNCGLTAISLPEGVTRIDEKSFYGNTSMKIVTIPVSVTSIGKNAFSGCTTLATVCYNGSKEQWEAVTVDEGNDRLTSAAFKYGVEAETLVQELHILHREGLDLEANAVLDGKIILVDLGKIESFTIGCQVVPENAENVKISWNTYDLIAEPVFHTNGDVTIKKIKPGNMTLYAQNSKNTANTATVRFQFRQVVMGKGFSGYLKPGESEKLPVRVEGDGDLVRSFRWSILEDTSGKASITSDGVLTAGDAEGTVTVRAVAADGSGLSGEMTVNICNYAVVIEGPDQVAGGKSIPLTATLVPHNLTKTKIQWKLKNPEEAEQYVQKFSNGTLTAKKVTEKQEVTVIAYTADGKASEAEKTILVVPVATTSVAILRGEETVTGKTVTVDLNTVTAPIALTAVTAPGDASKQVKWTDNDTKDVITTELSGEDTILITPTGKTGTVTLTATATDGSKKKTTVKLQFVRAATEIAILNNPGVLRSGSKITLTTSVATQENLTDRNVTWNLSADSLPYASITAKGVLTTYAFPATVKITVRATVKATGVSTEEVITLIPGATEARISLGGKVLAKNETLYVPVDGAVTLVGSVLPENAIQAGTWKVSGKGAVLKDNGDGTATVTMTDTKTATVTFTTADGTKKSTAIKVKGVRQGEAMTITAKGGATELRSGKSLQLTAEIPGASETTFNWSVDKPQLATVTKGKVKALTVYENTTITVTATAVDGSGLSASYVLKLLPAKDKTLHILLGDQPVTGTTRYMSVGAEPLALSAAVYDSLTDTWTKVDAAFKLSKKALEVTEEGTYRAKATGSSTLTATYEKLSAKVTVSVVNPAERIELIGGSSVMAGKNLKFNVRIWGANGLKPTVTKVAWSVDDPTVATISASGVLKAAKTVTKDTVVTITAAATDGSGVIATYQVTVYPQIQKIIVKANGIVLNQCVREFKVGDVLTLTAEVLPETAMKNVTWGKLSGKLAHYDENGNLVLDSADTLTLKVTTADGSKTETIKIKIVK